MCDGTTIDLKLSGQFTSLCQIQ